MIAKPMRCSIPFLPTSGWCQAARFVGPAPCRRCPAG